MAAEAVSVRNPLAPYHLNRLLGWVLGWAINRP